MIIMDTKVSYAVAGTFVIALLSLIIVIIIWLSAGFNNKDYVYYKVFMKESISGLSKDGPVEFNGVNVGTVKSMRISHKNPQLVILLLQVEADTPVTMGTRAKLGMKALTGTAYLLLEDKGADMRPLKAEADQEYPVIATVPSILVRLDTTLKKLSMVKRALLIVSLSILVSGCSMFGPVKTDNYTTYVLDTVPYTKKGYHENVTLYVASVEADPLYNSNGMAYTDQPYQVDYFAKNKWSDTPARMLQPLIVQTLRNTHRFHAITTSSNTRSDFVLNTKIIELRQLFVCKSSYIKFRLNAEIVDARTGHIIASKQFNVNQPASLNPQSGVEAANRAVGVALKQLANFCLKII